MAICETLQNVASLPAAVARLAKYLRKNRDGKKKGGAYSVRLNIAPDVYSKSRPVDIGLNTCQLEEALRRAGELVSLCYFCGVSIRNRRVDAPMLSCLFPLVDLSDDLGSAREEEEESACFMGGNAGLPFFIRWSKENPPPRR